MKELKGDLLKSGCDIICHQCNCLGAMGAGIALQIKNEFPRVYRAYKKLCMDSNPTSLLGTIQAVETKKGIIINCFSQYHFKPIGCQTNYNAVRTCMQEVKNYAVKLSEKLGRPVRVGLPYLYGCGLGGGDWSIVLPIIREELDNVKEIQLEIWRLK